MKTGLSFIALLFFSCASHAVTAVSLQELLERVKHSTELEQQFNQQREARFISEREQQVTRLEQSRIALLAQHDRHEKLKAIYDEQQKKFVQQKELLDDKSRNLDELFGIVRQSASETSSLLKASFTHIESPDGVKPVIKLANSTELPTIVDLEAYWHALLDEMVASGVIKTFSSPVITENGIEEEKQVTRIGLFSIFSADKFLRFLPESGHLIELPRQPAIRYRQLLINFNELDTASTSTMITLPVDPTRGALLSLLTRTPTFIEKIQQGGWIGYLILALGAIGLLIVLERFIILLWVGKKMQRQAQASDAPATNNPLGRLLQTCLDNASHEAEALMLKLEECIREEAPKLNRGMATLLILASIAPLLGLLGTVTGMIATFQSITLFGTGDPKMMSGGISQALVTTQLGLAVAIPIMLFYTLLAAKSRRLINLLDKQSAALVAKHITGKAE